MRQEVTGWHPGLLSGLVLDRTEQDLKLRRFSPATIRNYLLCCRNFAAFFMRPPEELGEPEVRAYLMHLMEVQQVAYSSYRQTYAALKFLYTVTLGRPKEVIQAECHDILHFFARVLASVADPVRC